MAELTDTQKSAIITALARFARPAEVVVMMRDEFGVVVELPQISRYNPHLASYEGGEKWRDLFDEQRKAYIEEVSAVPVANQGFRLRRLQHYIEEAEKKKQWALAAGLLEQAAKEVGGVLTNDRNLRVTDDRKMRPEDMTSEERRAAVAEIIRQVIEAPAPIPAPPMPTPAIPAPPQ